MSVTGRFRYSGASCATKAIRSSASGDPAGVPGTPLGVPLHPTQLYASMVQFLLFVLLLWLLHRPHHDGEILGAWLFLGGLSGFLLTLLRGDGIVTTQLVSAVMVLGGGLLWLRRPQVAHAG